MFIKPLTYCLILTLAVSDVWAQRNNLLGKIIDSQNGVGVSYAQIFVDGVFAGYADSLGNFTIKEKTNSIILSAKRIGYKAKDIKIENYSYPIVIALTQEENHLNELVIKPEKKDAHSIDLTHCSKKLHGEIYFCNRDYLEIARQFFIKENLNQFQITKIKFYVTKKGKPHTPTNINIYSANENHLPEKSLLRHSITVTPKKNGHWVEVNLDTLNLITNEKEFFIALEWLPLYKQHYYSSSDFSNCKTCQPNTCYGPVIGLTKEIKENVSYLRSNPAKKWYKNEVLPNQPFITNYMIGVEIKIIE